MMPFLSEELYQKLRAFPKKFQTICKADYPQPEESKEVQQKYAEIEKQFT